MEAYKQRVIDAMEAYTSETKPITTITILCGLIGYDVLVLIPITNMDEMQAYINTFLDYSGDDYPEKERIYKYTNSDERKIVIGATNLDDALACTPWYTTI